jgi:hypothetical protein
MLQRRTACAARRLSSMPRDARGAPPGGFGYDTSLHPPESPMEEDEVRISKSQRKRESWP